MRLKMLIACCVGLLSLLTIVPAVTYAAIPQQINYQGYLTDSTGNPVSDGDYDISFAIYSTPTGDTSLWGESQTVTVTDGKFSVILGQPGNLIDPDIFDVDRYLGIAVGTDDEMDPRIKFTSTAFSMQAAKAVDADTLDGKDSTALDQSAHVARTDNPHSVTTTQTGAASMSDITWGNLSNIPAGFSDGVDDTGGITAETDPTVLASVKNGVSWSELAGIPAGFLDGVDNVGGSDITGVTTVNPLVGGGTSGNVTLSVDIPFEITSSVDPAIISASNSYSTGYGVYGEATNVGYHQNYGGYFEAAGVYGRAVYGEATGTIGTNHGGMFIGHGPTGRGVFGEGKGIFGIGVKGVATNTGTYTNYGGYFEASGSTGMGVWGEASGGAGRGVSGKVTGPYGMAVHGEATDTSTTNYGGYFTASGVTGRGVYAEASGSTGRGLYGSASGSTGRGVYGEATNTGSYGNYGGYFEAAGVYGRAVHGEATGTTGTNHGGVFIAHGPTGRGVYAEGTGIDGIGVKGVAPATGYAGYFEGRVLVGVLEITGGSDIAEPFAAQLW
jgi:hypothetical protein